MLVFLNGKFVPEERALVSVFDRGFLYGDALFEGMLVRRGRIFRWPEHFERLQRGVDFLKLTAPFSDGELHGFALQLIEKNEMPECMLRLSLSRGITARGYSPENSRNPAVVMTVHPVAADPGKLVRWKVITSSYRLLANDPLTGFKTANKLPQVLARAEADSVGAQEAILLNSSGFIAEGTTSNLFWIKDGAVVTPALPTGALPGITRRLVLELCDQNNIPRREKRARPAELREAQGAFLTMTSMGVVEIESLDGQKVGRSPLVKKIWAQYRRLLETS